MMRFMAHFEKSISESGERQEKTKVRGPKPTYFSQSISLWAPIC